MKRRCGVLLPVSSLPSRYGIGAFSKEAYRFIDFLKAAGQTYWQILPLGQTGYGDSPYQSFSTFAGNPYFIDLEQLVKAGYLTQGAVSRCHFGRNPEQVDYEAVYKNRFPLLRKAYENSPFALQVKEEWAGSEYGKDRDAFAQFCEDNSWWLDDYALFSALKDAHQGAAYITWPADIRRRKPAALAAWREKLQNEIRFYAFQQYIFMQQWKALKEYANESGISIIGDIPIYVAFDSADTWSHPELFKFDRKGYPTVVAGCPPDGFAAMGQLWGNPIYKWSYHKKTGYAWWLKRIQWCFTLYDVVRIDHFRGFDEYYAIPYGDPTAEFGHWEKGPGISLFKAVHEKLGEKQIIAEDLGFMTDSVVQLVKRTGYPGMKVLQFAFDSREESNYLPHTYTRNCVVYTGTHDNQTMRGWYDSESGEDKKFAEDYVGVTSEKTAAWSFIRCAFESVADTCIIPMQDYLNLGDEARINTPSTTGGNWVWRMKRGADSDALAARMKNLAVTFKRV